MTPLEKFAKKISIELKRNLPGFSAQRKMAPLGRKPPIEYLKKGIKPKKSAVLILLYPGSTRFIIKTALIQRPEYDGTHAGQISFPGGGFERSDRGMSETALRETEEEIGVKRARVSIIGKLTPLYIPVSNYMVHPYVGIYKTVPKFKINHLEVKKLLELPLKELIADKNIGTVEKYVRLKEISVDVPCYRVKGKIIWGATAMIISELAEVVKRMK